MPSRSEDTGSLNDAPKGMRLQIALFGRRNVGKSSLVNALTRQKTALVSDVPGTTTDPVEKAMELLPLGPVLLVDTAGIDDEGELGQARVERTRKVMDSADLAVLATEPGVWGEFERQVASELRRRGIPFVVAVTKSDLAAIESDRGPALRAEALAAGAGAVVRVSSATLEGIEALKAALVDAAPEIGRAHV